MKDLTILVLYVVTSNMYLSVHSKSDWIFTDGGNGCFFTVWGAPFNLYRYNVFVTIDKSQFDP